MFFLAMFGDNVEDMTGTARFLLAYLLAGAAGTALYALTAPQPHVALVGASGAVSGVIGMYLVLFPRASFHTHVVFLWWRLGGFRSTAALATGAWFGQQLLLAGLSSWIGSPILGVAFWAHLGGFAAGIVLGFLFGRVAFGQRRLEGERRQGMNTESEQQPTSESRGPRRFERFSKELVLWLRTLASAAVYTTLIVTFGFQVARVEGRSMEPTLEDDDRLVVNKLGYRLQDPEVGDIVMLLHPARPSLTLVKRIVAGPGDRIAFRQGVVMRNGVLEDEDFIPAGFRSHEDLAAIVVPEGYYFVLGDHRNNSSDSRTFGPVPKKYILGRVQARWWPIERATFYEP